MGLNPDEEEAARQTVARWARDVDDEFFLIDILDLT